jgi:AraC-like DNA-binding protein
MEAQDPLVSSLYITDIGHYPQAKYHHRVRKIGISQYVLIYCVDGSGFYRLGDKTYEVKRNQYFILPSGVPHEYGATEGEKWTIYWVHFKGEHAAVYAEGAQTPQTISVALNSRISERNNIFEEMLSTLQQGTELEDLRYVSSLLHHYLASMRYLCQFRRGRNSIPLQPDAQQHTIVTAAKHFMDENIERRITLKDVLQYVGYSQSHFNEIFHKQMGVSPLVYFKQQKIKHACHLLVMTDLKINQICYKLGFDDSLYFSRMFKKHTGMSPRAYRQAHAQNEVTQINHPL